MTRAALSLMLCGLCLGGGLYTSNKQAENYAMGAELDGIKRRCDLLEASSERVQFDINVTLRRIDQALPAELIAEQAEGLE